MLVSLCTVQPMSYHHLHPLGTPLPHTHPPPPSNLHPLASDAGVFVYSATHVLPPSTSTGYPPPSHTHTPSNLHPLASDAGVFVYSATHVLPPSTSTGYPPPTPPHTPSNLHPLASDAGVFVYSATHVLPPSTSTGYPPPTHTHHPLPPTHTHPHTPSNLHPLASDAGVFVYSATHVLPPSTSTGYPPPTHTPPLTCTHLLLMLVSLCTVQPMSYHPSTSTGYPPLPASFYLMQVCFFIVYSTTRITQSPPLRDFLRDGEIVSCYLHSSAARLAAAVLNWFPFVLLPSLFLLLSANSHGFDSCQSLQNALFLCLWHPSELCLTLLWFGFF